MNLLALCLFPVSFALASCAPSVRGDAAPVLLFTGAGTSPNDVAAVEAILRNKHLEYATADTWQLNGMTEPQLLAFRLLIVPGGNFITMGDSLSAGALTKVHNAVQGGLNYLGLCAGAFLAGRGSTYKSIGLTPVQFGFYEAERRGLRKAAVMISSVKAQAIEHYWEDGPELSGWGEVVAKYSDGTPAVVEGRSGNGWVILTGTHPEAPESWRRGMTFTTPARVTNAYAGMLVEAALNGTMLPHY